MLSPSQVNTSWIVVGSDVGPEFENDFTNTAGGTAVGVAIPSTSTGSEADTSLMGSSAAFRMNLELVFMRGIVSSVSAIPGTWTTAFTLPQRYRPIADCYYPVSDLSTASARVLVTGTGAVQINPVTSGSSVTLDGIFFPIAPDTV